MTLWTPSVASCLGTFTLPLLLCQLIKFPLWVADTFQSDLHKTMTNCHKPPALAVTKAICCFRNSGPEESRLLPHLEPAASRIVSPALSPVSVRSQTHSSGCHGCVPMCGHHSSY